MALKYEVEDVSELDEAVQKLYTKADDGKYRLEVEGIDDGAELKEALRKEREDRKAAKSKLKELEDEKERMEQEAEEAKRKAAEKNGDVESLNKSWQEKIDKIEKEKQDKIAELEGTLTQLTSGQTATKMASEIAVQGSADVLLPHIEKRLKTEYKDGKPSTVVLDKDGNPSAMTIDELKEEFKSNSAFAPLIVGTKANGAGGHGGKGGDQNTVTREQFDAMSQHERSKFAAEGGKVVEP